QVLLGDVARVVDGFEELDVMSSFNGKHSLALDVYVTTNPDVLKTSAEVSEYIEQMQAKLPESVELVIWRDASDAFKGRLATLVSNGIGGLALVFVILLLFLRPLLAF